MKDQRDLILSVSIHDCVVQTYRGSGAGGQNRNKRDTGVRVIHPPSGARAESCEERSQLQNKRTAFLRMVETPAFRAWLSAVCNGRKTPRELEAEVEESLADPRNLKVEALTGNGWIEID